jgi:hypothetical protein
MGQQLSKPMIEMLARHLAAVAVPVVISVKPQTRKALLERGLIRRADTLWTAKTSRPKITVITDAGRRAFAEAMPNFIPAE